MRSIGAVNFQSSPPAYLFDILEPVHIVGVYASLAIILPANTGYYGEPRVGYALVGPLYQAHGHLECFLNASTGPANGVIGLSSRLDAYFPAGPYTLNLLFSTYTSLYTKQIPAAWVVVE